MPLYDFVCEDTRCGAKVEALVPSDVKYVNCPSCDYMAKRQLCAPKIDYLRMGLDPYGNPTAGDKWAKMQEQKNRTPTSPGESGS